MFSLVKTIHSHYDQFTPQQKLIADLILCETFVPEFRTAKALSARLNVSNSTIVRFAQKIGFDGYPALSREIHSHFENSPMLKIRKSILDLERSDNPLARACLFENKNLQKTESINSSEILGSVVDSFAKGGRVCFIGARAAYSLAYYAGFLFNQLEERFSFMNSSADDSYEKLSRMKSGDDVAFFISFHRYVRQTTRLAEFAHGKKLNVTVLTDTPYSPVAKMADHILLASNDAPFFSYVSAMMVLNTLLSSYARVVDEDIRVAFDKQNEMLLSKGVFI